MPKVHISTHRERQLRQGAHRLIDARLDGRVEIRKFQFFLNDGFEDGSIGTAPRIDQRADAFVCTLNALDLL